MLVSCNSSGGYLYPAIGITCLYPVIVLQDIVEEVSQSKKFNVKK